MAKGYCVACHAFVPVVRQAAGKAIPALVGGVLGSATKKWWGIVLGAGLAALIWYVVEEAIGAVCGQCGGPVSEIQPT